jgi:hypothetical protein
MSLKAFEHLIRYLLCIKYIECVCITKLFIYILRLRDKLGYAKEKYIRLSLSLQLRRNGEIFL